MVMVNKGKLMTCHAHKEAAAGIGCQPVSIDVMQEI